MCTTYTARVPFGTAPLMQTTYLTTNNTDTFCAKTLTLGSTIVSEEQSLKTHNLFEGGLEGGQMSS